VDTEQQKPPVKKFGLANFILIIVLGALLCGEAYFGYHLQVLSTQREQLKEDFSTINNITFGLFSVNQWRDKMAAIIDNKVSDFSITPAQKRAMLAQVEQQLNGMVHKTFADINKPQKTFFGRIKKIAVDKFVDTNKVLAQVPVFSKIIVDKVSSPASTQRLKNIATGTIIKLEQQTYDSTQTASNAVIRYMNNKYHVVNDSEFDNQINSRLITIQKRTYNYLYAMFGCVLVALGLWGIMRNQVHLHTTLFFMSLLFALVLLSVGITSSIIEVDALLKTFNLTLAGQNLSFGDQVLFFQSKSILGVVEVLIRQPKPDSVLVGALILLFVVILPVLRIVARGIHILSGKELAENKVVKYVAFEAGKWDMADVMVVGILMTYIGLNGILRSQLSNLEMHNSFISTSTLNETTLQPGYFVFVGYVVFAIILSAILKRIVPRDTYKM
jgi:hypothetical protein